MRCRTCHTPITEHLRFCPNCGELFPGETAERVMAYEAIRDGSVDPAELKRLRTDKATYALELQRLLEAADDRELSPDERREWSLLYTKWRDVAYELTELMDRLLGRTELERRHVERRKRERRQEEQPPAGQERRQGERRQGPIRSDDDRRDPYWNRVP
ncbi:MAG: hypothetical protein OER21_00305 [Gemmatimonadota bacterium]|nr:hypothetical protein [Gemmatimonadota bacterium]